MKKIIKSVIRFINGKPYMVRLMDKRKGKDILLNRAVQGGLFYCDRFDLTDTSESNLNVKLDDEMQYHTRLIEENGFYIEDVEQEIVDCEDGTWKAMIAIIVGSTNKDTIYENGVYL